VNFKAYTDAVTQAIGRELAQIRKDAENLRALMLAEQRAKMAEMDVEHRAKLAELDAEFAAIRSDRAQLSAALAEINSRVDARLAEVKDGERGRDGASVTVADVEPLLRDMVDEKVAEIPVPKDGAPGKDGERGEPGPMGSLAQCKAWEDRVYYQGETATFDGSIFQAQRDTGKEPPHEDWICIVRAGRDGADGRSFDHAGLYEPEKNYSALQVVQLNGASFVAKRDNPGECPGDGWALLASQGKTGKPGPKGDPGARGPAGPAVARLVVDDTGMLTLVNADGSKIECDLYPLLERIDR
jgi:hypothetical protein